MKLSPYHIQIQQCRCIQQNICNSLHRESFNFGHPSIFEPQQVRVRHVRAAIEHMAFQNVLTIKSWPRFITGFLQ